MSLKTPLGARANAEDGAKPSRFRTALPILLVALLLDSAYLYLANHASGPPRVELAAFSYEGTLLLHLGLGALTLGYFVTRLRALAQALRERRGALGLFSALTTLSLAVCLVTGVAFLGIGFQWLSLNARPLLRAVHDFSTAGFLIFGLLTLFLRARKSDAEATLERRQARGALRLSLALGLPFVGMLAYTLYAPNSDRVIVNPAVPPMTAFDEGDGPTGKFFPASVQSVNQQFFPSEYFVDSKSCGVAGCHPDIYAQWNSSAHHLSSFNNQWYRKSIEYAQEVVGTKATKWCGGCHDMAVLLTEDPKNPGHSRFDRPIADHDWPPQQHPESHAGIGCAACHSVVHVKSTMGVSDYTLDYPPMHKYILAENQVTKSLQNFLTRLAPEPHKKTFLRPFHKDQTAKFCASCHKVHLDKPVNNYRWLRGQNTYDEWQGSGVSGLGAASFYYPMDEKTGQPAFKKCADCHMPNTASKDAGNFGGFVHSHRFPAANTALPTVYHDAKQMEATVKFLQNKALSIDIFGIRREKATAGGARSASAGAANRPAANAPRQTASPRPSDTPQAASISGDTSGNAPAAAANAPIKPETLVAPLNRGGAGAVLRRGESPLIDVVVRTLKLGHAFPGGTNDAFDCWVELEAKDNTGRVFYHSGKLQWPDGPVEDAAHRYRVLPVDAHSNAINKRNVFAIRSLVYAKVIPPGAADAVHFRLRVPKDCGSAVTLTARLNYRKFEWFDNYFMYAGRMNGGKPKTPNALKNASDTLPTAAANSGYDPHGTIVGIGADKTSGPVGWGWDDRKVTFDADTSTVSGDIKDVPVLPITVLASDTITLPVVDANAKMDAPVTPPDEKKDRIRWNDYGIGLLLQGDFRGATNAFAQVTKLSPKWPEGYVNIGRVRQAERDSRAAEAAFNQAFTLYDAKPTPMTPYQKARTQNFYAQTLFDEGRLDEALNVLSEARKIFPDDRNIRDLSGTILFRLGRYNEAIQQLTYTLTIDPEDIAAHYNLMKCFRAKGDAKNASLHEAIYKRFKADESTTNLTGPYKRAHPADNNLAQPIHEQPDAIVHPKPAWLVQRENRIARAKAKKPAAKVALR